ncbi:MAG TPA: FGGY-family carbohydrate kinase [Terriglobia bacterium]|nr:FGGY-family carbohydrate kinase [Terriglobia bacterium]
MTDGRCLIGVDAGTSVVKAVAFDQLGNEVCVHETPMPLRQPQPLWIEQDMAQLWETVKVCLRSVAAQLQASKREIEGIGITSTGDGTWIIDREGKPVRGGILWCDGRAGKIVERLHAQGIAHRAFDICGTSVFTGSQAAQLLWLRENEPESLKKAQIIFHAKDWLFYKLTGLITSDETDESLTMLRMSTRQYDPELFKIFGIDDLYSKFPPVKATADNVAPLLAEVAAELGLPKGVAVGSGPMDVAACALGTGAIEHGQALSILGTAGIHEVIMEEPNMEPRMVGMTLCHGVKGRWIRMLAAMTATPNLDWFLKELGTGFTVEAREAGKDVYEHLEKAVESVPAGSEGVIFHPYLFPGGERGPFVKPTARASFTGLNMNHTAKHLLRAVYEGVAFATLDCYRHMPIDPKTVFLSGGGANSPAWCQIMADCLGKPVSVPEGSQFGARGAALNIGIAVGAYRDAQEAVAKSVRTARLYEPDQANTNLYRQLYEVYQQTAERQMDLWDLRAQIIGRMQ